MAKTTLVTQCGTTQSRLIGFPYKSLYEIFKLSFNLSLTHLSAEIVCCEKY